MALIQKHVYDRAKKGTRTKFNIFVLINRWQQVLCFEVKAKPAKQKDACNCQPLRLSGFDILFVV